ncbi:hypothetical protein NW762_004615 [Fusarium torreyae]|uniref:FAD dependent oxidoreductase domain-containing protein n=1 Tax=Fusarium torreyae TaxID=1237075 RepID=A0A9W8S505_9HYPO|nr:hypothetical protein NW762_004615 [Fusarium torreyae]
MVSPDKTRTWLKSPLGERVLAQVQSDPGLPQPMPTVSSWQLPPHADVGNIQSTVLADATDYLIIGSGIAGCGTAKSLLESPSSQSRTVTVLDARGLCSGATGRNGGQLVKPYPLRYVAIAEMYGVEMANKIARMNLFKLEEVHKLAQGFDEELRKEAMARRLTKLVAHMDRSSWEKSKHAIAMYEANLPEERGLFKPVSKDELEKKWKIKGAYGGYTYPAGVCWPYRLITGVFKRLLDRYQERLKIETYTPVTSISIDAEGNSQYPYIVTTTRGTIRATHVIHCTNGHTGHLLPAMRGMIHPIRGTMSSQSPGGNFPNLSQEMSWTFLHEARYDQAKGTTRLGWHYGLQNPPDGDVWIGGEEVRLDHFVTADDTYIEQEQRDGLSNILTDTFTKEWVPEKPKINGMWSGILANTGDHLPFVGQLPTSVTGRPGQGEWIAAGWNSYGMANGLTSGHAVAQMILGNGIPEWFPEAYLPTEERLHSESMKPEAVAALLLEWTGAGKVLSGVSAKL